MTEPTEVSTRLSAQRQQLFDGTKTLIDGLVGVRGSGRIGISEGSSSVTVARDVAGALALAISGISSHRC
jgi:hypothetical protein